MSKAMMMILLIVKMATCHMEARVNPLGKEDRGTGNQNMDL
jgi:hypothetical protein